MKKIAILTSGGFDSNVLVRLLVKKFQKVFPVYIRSGLVWEKAELYWLKKFLNKIQCTALQPLTILESPVKDLLDKSWSVTGKNTPDFYSHDKEVYIPGRNLILLSKTAVFCAQNQIPTLAIGTLKGNPFPDATPKFFKDFEKLVQQGLGFRIRILTPFIKMSKDKVAQILPNLPLDFSFSCLSPRKLKACGNCNKCAEMKKIQSIRE